jgi:phosphoglycerate kinase
MKDRYAHMHSPLTRWNLAHKHVFLRADLNVPLEQGKILDDSRLRAIQPTLDYILAQGGRITLACHLGRPTGYDPQLSTAQLKPWFAAAGYDERVTLYENLRFFAEQPENSAFAQQLASGIDYYINDAFASCHRTGTSLTLLPKLFDKAHRGIGLLIEKELKTLSKIKYHAEKPFVLILGGGKGEEKLRFLEAMLPRINTALLCPLLSQAYTGNNPAVHKPADYLVGSSWHGPYSYKKSSEITPQDIIVAIGPETVAAWKPIIMNAHTIFFNGPMGDLTNPATTRELQAVLQSVAQSAAFSVIGGGSSVAALHLFDLVDQVDFCSTGGGATLAYLSDQPLPALDALLS